jgi:hypothetical protein
MNRIVATLKALAQGLELLLPICTGLRLGFQGRGYCRDVLDVALERLLFRVDGV